MISYKQLTKWNTRVSIVYAVGIWTMIGSYAYYKYTGRFEDIPVKKPEEEDLWADNPNVVISKTPHSKTVIVYRENYVPLTTRIKNLMNYFSSESGGEDK